MILPRFLQSYYTREQIFAPGNHHLLAKHYSENHYILSKSHIMNLVVQTFLFNFDHSSCINSMLFGEKVLLWACSRARLLKSRKQAKECNNSGETEEVVKKAPHWHYFYENHQRVCLPLNNLWTLHCNKKSRKRLSRQSEEELSSFRHLDFFLSFHFKI